ncbi:Inorganic triphosphatase YgiF, contains CYTH and CHAD domains [Marinobacter daqiaonensis]|uniref:Inorganic triphosphatase YgiF, contains CYTH and CHAD domains n=1 Tax=Marinobacter daqiaonensis TaxID=650891 RepID=A0A1I6K1R4_9GAMM|nr:CYTH domain-containing protein [Marinobacter daqiaonensis]SFR85173.1 Inorganic triphosphatase YgiF, contains CYTH and CHAD domains [Marinobacter daqiaonensis]
MAEELEIKLSLTPGALSQARQWLSARENVTAAGDKTLVNRYYDTPDGELNRQKAALRVRQAGDRYIQTLKTQGEFVEGAHRREEWEWPLAGTGLNIGLIADTPVGDNINLAELEPVFETNFERTLLMIRTEDGVIECALDRGSISAGGRVRDLCELELELKEGSDEALLPWARQLSVQVPVFLNLISKAEQGYELAGLHDPQPLPDQEPLVNRVLHGLSRAWLSGTADRSLKEDLARLSERHDLGETLAGDLAWLEKEMQKQPMADLAASSTRLGQFQLALLELGH